MIKKYTLLLFFLCPFLLSEEIMHDTFSEQDLGSMDSMEEFMRAFLIENCVNQFCEKFKISDKVKKEKEKELAAFSSDLLMINDELSSLTSEMSADLINEKLVFPKVKNKDVFFKIIEIEALKSNFKMKIESLKKKLKDMWINNKKNLKGVIDFAVMLSDQKKDMDQAKKDIFNQYDAFIKNQMKMSNDQKMEFADQVIGTSIYSICLSALE